MILIDVSVVLKSPLLPESLSMEAMVGALGGVVSLASIIVSDLLLELNKPFVSTV